MSNPYVQKFSKAFNTGLFAVVFIALVIVASCMPQPVNAAQIGRLPVVCLTTQEFQEEHKNGDFEIVSAGFAVIFPEGEAQQVRKVVTSSTNKDGTVVGTWLVDPKSNVCLVMMENIGKQVKM